MKPILLLTLGLLVCQIGWAEEVSDESKAVRILSYMTRCNNNQESGCAGFTGVNYEDALETIKNDKWDWEKMRYRT